MKKVQALLDKAASTGFTAEAEECRRKADELMTTYVIAEHELRAAGSVADREAPSKKSLWRFVSGGSPIKQQVASLASSVGDYVGVKLLYYGMRQGSSPLGFEIYGFKAEIEYFEMLLTSLMVQMSNEMEPKYDTNESVYTNMENFRGAGIGWDRLFEVFKAHGVPKSQAMDYRKMWLRDNPDQRNMTPTTYLRSFAEGFALEVNRRLWDLKRARQTSLSNSMALVLVDRSSEVAEFYAAAADGLRPIRSQEQRMTGLGIARGREAGARADLGGGRISNPSPKAIR
jgi:hypothetical protein